MRLSIRQYAVSLLELEKELGEGQSKEAGKKFVAWLNRRGEGKKLGNIIAAAEERVCEQSGVVEVAITTAHEADAMTRDLLETQAKRVFATKKVAMSFMTDAHVLGGVRMQSKEVLYDATLKTSLEQLKISLTK